MTLPACLLAFYHFMQIADCRISAIRVGMLGATVEKHNPAAAAAAAYNCISIPPPPQLHNYLCYGLWICGTRHTKHSFII